MFNDFYDIESNNTPSTFEDKRYESASSDDKPKFTKKPANIKRDPYVPICFFVDRDYPANVKEEFFVLIDKFVNKKYTVRVNGDDKEFCARVQTLSNEFVEIYIPWKGFNEIESKHYFNEANLSNIAQINFPGWEKVQKSIQSLLTRNVRMILGDKNNSCCVSIVLWTNDGAFKITDVTKDTGKLSFIIKLAGKYGIPVVNLNSKKANFLNFLVQNYGL